MNWMMTMRKPSRKELLLNRMEEKDLRKPKSIEREAGLYEE